MGQKGLGSGDEHFMSKCERRMYVIRDRCPTDLSSSEGSSRVGKIALDGEAISECYGYRGDRKGSG
jgi:hypothetical protein